MVEGCLLSVVCLLSGGCGVVIEPLLLCVLIAGLLFVASYALRVVGCWLLFVCCLLCVALFASFVSFWRMIRLCVVCCLFDVCCLACDAC